MTRVLATLQHHDLEGYQRELHWGRLNPTRRKGSENLEVLRKYLEHMIQKLRAPMVHYYEGSDPHYEDI